MYNVFTALSSYLWDLLYKYLERSGYLALKKASKSKKLAVFFFGFPSRDMQMSGGAISYLKKM
jgi:hypothetical protein